jgi:DNA-directed RNA polymerase subunit alpha
MLIPRGTLYTMFVVEPFETSFAYSLGNIICRILLGSIGGVAVVAVTMDGVSHEFQNIQA